MYMTMNIMFQFASLCGFCSNPIAITNICVYIILFILITIPPITTAITITMTIRITMTKVIAITITINVTSKENNINN